MWGKINLSEEKFRFLKGEMRMNEVIKERIARLRAELHKHPALVCSKCGSIIHETITGKYETANGVLCKICFSEFLGAEIEKHPIRSAPLEKVSK